LYKIIKNSYQNTEKQGIKKEKGTVTLLANP